MKRNQLLILLMIVFVTQSIISAQSKSCDDGTRVFSPKMLIYDNLNNADVLTHFRTRFLQLDSMLDRSVEVVAPSIGVRSVTREILLSDSLFAAKTTDEAAALRRHTGLEVTGQLYARPDEMVVNDADDDDISRYRAKAQAELGWNIINSRFYQGREKYRKISLTNELDRLRQAKLMGEGVYDEAVEVLTEIYNGYTAIAIACRLANLDILNEANQFLLERDRISNDKMVDVMTDKMDAEYQLSVLGVTADIVGQPLVRLTPTKISVDTAELMVVVTTLGDNARIRQVCEELVDNESRLTNYLSTTRLTPFVRWSSYWQSSGRGVSNNADIGVRFTIPLYDDSSRKRKALATQKEIIRTEADADEAKVRQQCTSGIKRIEGLNRAIAVEKVHLEQLASYIELRRNAYDSRQASGYNYIQRLEEYNEYLKSLERMSRLMLSRAVVVINIMKVAGLNDADTQKIFTESLI